MPPIEDTFTTTVNGQTVEITIRVPALAGETAAEHEDRAARLIADFKDGFPM